MIGGFKSSSSRSLEKVSKGIGYEERLENLLENKRLPDLKTVDKKITEGYQR